jgi:HSP20 family molecular chaperone IbpA
MAALTTPGRAPALPADAHGEYVARLAVPGFACEELAVELVDHVVTVTGDRTRVERGARLHDRLQERVELPPDVDADRLTASYGRGALELHAPRFHDGSPPSRKVAIRRPFALNPDASGV